jgi:SAM-dependent methyltransferase
MNEQTLKLLTDLHIRNYRQGPGSDVATLRALELSGIDTNAPLAFADIGCGTGASSILLAKHTKGHITAVDFLPAFLEKLKKDAEQAGVANRIITRSADMGDLPFEDEQFDVIWSEGAIYNIGFKTGIEAWKKYLKPNGILVATEITWLTSDVPKELSEHWAAEYPEVAPASTKIKQLEDSGYIPLGYFPLSPDCWMDEYYTPLCNGFEDFLARNENSEAAQAIVEAEKIEIALYEKYMENYSYGCYIAKKQS